VIRRSRHGLAARLAVALAASAAVLSVPARAAEDELGALLAARALERTRNPVVANFLLEEGAPLLRADEAATARRQLSAALRTQTDFFALTMQGMAKMRSLPSMRQAQEAAGAGGGLRRAVTMGVLGVGPATPMPQADQVEREMRQAMTDPWVRGIAAAQALERAGDVQGAARFYVNCLQLPKAEWVPAACLDGILGLGPERAEKVLVWMLDNAEELSWSAMAAGFGQAGTGQAGTGAKDAPPEPGVVQLRNSALSGLGALVGSGSLDVEARERAMGRLLAFAASTAPHHELYRRGVAEGFGRARDPRGLAPLRRLAAVRRDADVKQVALRGLAVGFADEAAVRQLRGELDDRDPEEQLRAAQALYELGDEAAFRWAVEVIGKRRTTDAKKPDIRALVVRDLVELGGERARGALAQALAEGPPNDWITAWLRVSLLELGDLAQLPAVEAALVKEDWALDPRGFRSVWRAIRPLLQAVASTLASGGLAAPSALQQAKQAVQVVGNLVHGERSRHLAKAGQREAVVAQLRWQTADALAVANPPGAARILEGMLASPDAATRLSAASALARLDQQEAMAGMLKAFTLDYGDEDGVPRTPEVRAALLRAALLRSPGDPRTAEMLALGSTDEDPAVRVVALVGRRRAA
jgi:HEAT repeat protein